MPIGSTPNGTSGAGADLPLSAGWDADGVDYRPSRVGAVAGYRDVVKNAASEHLEPAQIARA